jgi:restriction endonuclease S subunit
MSKWPNVEISKFLVARQETPEPEKISSGKYSIISKISFSSGQIELRDHAKTNTNMITIKPGDLVISGINAGKGAIAIYGKENERPATATIHYSSYSVDSNKADIEFLWFFFRSEVFREILRLGLPNGIKTELRPNKFLSLEIPLPPLSEQKRIVKKIKEIEEKINIIKSKIKKEVLILDSIFPSFYNNSINKEKIEHRSIPLSKIIKRYKKEILINDTIEYERITIRTNNLGISMRDSLLGEKIGTKKQFLVKAGQLLLSKIDARNGAFGIVPKDLDGAIITGNFWAYDINDDLVNNEFIRQFVQTESFSEYCKRSSSGATNRRYLDENIFLNQTIVLPDKKIQEKICHIGLLSQSFKKNRNDQIKILNCLLPSVLAKAFNGEL